MVINKLLSYRIDANELRLILLSYGYLRQSYTCISQHDVIIYCAHTFKLYSLNDRE